MDFNPNDEIDLTKIFFNLKEILRMFEINKLPYEKPLPLSIPDDAKIK